jgi:endonuclease YncB( thermonuclease family)
VSRSCVGRAALAFVAVVVAASLASAGGGRESFDASVVAVHDGDTISVRAGRRTIRVRLSGVDCPEARQPFAARAKRFTSDRVFGRTVRVEGHGLDTYDRLLARIVVDGEDLNEALVRAGLAWHYPFGTPDPRLEDAERAARAARTGLWSDAAPVPPWRWRKLHPR